MRGKISPKVVAMMIRNAKEDPVLCVC